VSHCAGALARDALHTHAALGLPLVPAEAADIPSLPGHAAIAPHQAAPHVSKPRRIEQALRGFAFWPPSRLRLVLAMEGVECLMK
jgi:hypothetical protein